MELIQGTCKASKLSTKDDIISSMPDIVITHILNLLPIKDVVRTSILAKNWRLKWNLLTQLVFDVEGNNNDNWYDERIIGRLLISLKGPITKFFLHVPDEKKLNVKYLCHWVSLLSKKGVREFTLENFDEIPIMFPTHLFSCIELTHLKLFNCYFSSAPTCGSFPNLLNLEVSRVTFPSDFCEIITMCPRLEILEIGVEFNEDPIKVKLVEIAKLKDLKMLSLPWRVLAFTPVTKSLISHSGDYFPKLEELYLSFLDSSFVGEEAVSRELVCDYFSCVKTLALDCVDFGSSIMLASAFDIIWGCPNLQTLTITASCESSISSVAICPSELNNITMGQLQLLYVVFEYFRGSENELLFIKNLLAYTPLLKKITIYPYQCHDYDGYKGKLILANKLLMFHRASAIAQVDFRCF